MSRIISYSAWLFSIVLVSLASAGAVHAATETVTLKNGNTYEVEIDRRGEPVVAENRQVKMTFLSTFSYASPPSNSPAYVWMWNARLKSSGAFKVTVTTPIDETVSASFDVVGRDEIGNKFFFNSEEYPTLWTWLDEPETSWIPFVFTFEDTQSDNKFALTQWARFDAPLYEAAMVGDIDRVNRLIANGADVNAQDDYGLAPLHAAVINGHGEMVQFLVANGANVGYLDQNNTDAIELAYNNEHSELAPFLIEAWPGPLYQPCLPIETEQATADGEEEPKLYAHFICRERALGCKTDPNGELCQQFLDELQLDLPAIDTIAPWWRSLAEYELSLNAEGTSLLYEAAQIGDRRLIEAMIEIGVDVDYPARGLEDIAPVGNAWTPLMHATAEGHEEVVSILIQAGADVNAKNELGRTSLMFSANYGFFEIAEMLLENGANTDDVANDEGGWPAIIAASANGHRNIVILLLEHGADQNIRDNSGKTALMWAEERGHRRVARTLERSQ